jgi:hypothetical protein
MQPPNSASGFAEGSASGNAGFLADCAGAKGISRQERAILNRAAFSRIHARSCPPDPSMSVETCQECQVATLSARWPPKACIVRVPATTSPLCVVMSMRGGWRCLTTVPKRHLAPVSSVEDVAFDSRCRLICCGDPVCWMLHELREVVHGRLLSHSWRRLVWPLLARSTENRYTADSRPGFTYGCRLQPLATTMQGTGAALVPRKRTGSVR